MGESDDIYPKAGVPSWQLKPTETPQEGKAEAQDSAPQPAPSRAAIIANARKFLLEDEVRNAPTDKQVAFLEGKGLESHEIQELLGVTRNAEATASTPESTSSQTTSEPVAPLTIPSPSASLQSSTQKSFDAPPIITYPEFLTTPQRPAPLITAKRLLNTLYLFGSLSALLYGTNKYLFKPMIASLTSSRHELAETAQENVEKLVEKLEGMVSEKPQVLQSQRRYDIEDEDSDSDPTELFHRDIGIQTSIPNSPPNSRPSTPLPTTQAFETQTKRLATLTSHLKDLNEASTSEGQDTQQLSTCVSILRDYLDSLAYTQPVFGYGSGGIYNNLGQKTEAADDEIAKVKAQIKSMKGVMLNARSFPGGTWQRQSTLVK